MGLAVALVETLNGNSGGGPSAFFILIDSGSDICGDAFLSLTVMYSGRRRTLFCIDRSFASLSVNPAARIAALSLISLLLENHTAAFLYFSSAFLGMIG